MWNCIYYVLHKYIERHPDWIVRTHEALSLDPVNEFKALYDFLNLVWDDETSSAIIDFTSPKNIVNPPDGEVHHLRRNSKENIDRWKNVLTKDEIEQILLATKDIRLNFYDK